jgi:hypothetical protein
MNCYLRGLLPLAIVLASIALVPPAEAAESAKASREFVEGLRRRGCFDEAIDYLEQMRVGRQTDAAFQETIDYETGVTLIDAAGAARSDAQRDQLLSRANERLAGFLAAHPHHALAAAAQTQLGNVLVEQGRVQVEQARPLDSASQQQKQLMESARALYEQAEAVFVAAEGQLRDAHDKLPLFIDPKDAKKIQRRDQVRRDLAQTQLALARVLFEIARTYRPGSPENMASLTDAAKKYGALYEKHRGNLAGLYARLGEARAYKELGQVDKSLGIFGELLAQPDEPEALALLKTQTTLLAMETALSPAARKYREALAIFDSWQRAAHSSEASLAESMAIRFLAGEAALKYARTLSEDDKEQSPVRSECLRVARRSFANVAAKPNPYREKARARLADPLLASRPTESTPGSFEEARQRGNAAMDRLTIAEAKSTATPTQSPAGQSGLLSAARQEAIKYYTLALKLQPDDISDEQLDSIRYCLAYLHFKAGDLREAAELGMDIAGHDSEHPQARQGAKIALAAYAALFNEARTPEDRQALASRLLDIATAITAHWEDEPEAADAWMVLLQDAVADGRLDQASQYLRHIPVASGRRRDAELAIGQASWSAWQQAWQLPPAQRPPLAELDELLAQARQMLTDGVGQPPLATAAGGKASATSVRSALALAQLELSAGQGDKAVAWLEDARVGPKTLADAQDPIVAGDLGEEIRRTALQAYIVSQQWVKAEATLRDLEPAQPNDPEAARQAIQAIIRSGHDLQEQVQLLQSRERPAELGKLESSYGRFLWQVAERPQDNTFYSLQWMAESYFGLAAAFDVAATAEKPPREAIEPYQNAADAYRKLLRRCDADKKFSPHPDAPVALKVRLAHCLRRLGNTTEALSLLAGVLKDHPTMVDAQVEAAYTYEERGREKAADYLLAITGSQKYREIWGWGELARRLAKAPEYRDTFCEARYNLALCRYRLAQNAVAADERAELLRRAEEDILATRGFCPDMGGKSWYDKYEELLKNIKRTKQ